MNVTVTGACGHLGTFVTRALVEGGCAVRATDRSLPRDFPVRVEIANLLDREACYGLVDGADAVVHLGNYPGMLRGISAQQLFCENTTMNMNVFQAAQEAGVKKILFSSSVQAFSGKQGANEAAPRSLPYLPLDGDVPPNPGNPYALSKQVAEAMLAYFARDGQMDCVAVRFPRLLDPEWLKHLKGGLVNSGEGFAFLHLTDAAALILACLNASLPGFRIYFAASTGNGLGKPAAEVIREHYANVPLRRPLEQIDSLVDISRIQAETGWTPKNNNVF